MLPSARLLMLVAITCTALALGGTTPLPTQGCLNWTAAAPVTLEVDGLTPLLLDERCNGHLDGVQLTLYCGVNASVTLSGWVMEGGAVSVLGPKATPWALTNVSVFVVNSRIHATLGPAVGVLAGAQFAGPGGPTITNLTLSAYNSTLISNTSVAGAVIALGIAKEAQCSRILTLDGVTIVAHQSQLIAVGAAGDVVAVVAGFGVSDYAFAVNIRRFEIALYDSDATVRVDGYAKSAAAVVGGIAFGTIRQPVSVMDSTSVITGGSLSAVALGPVACAAAVGGVGVGTLLKTTTTVMRVAFVLRHATVFAESSSPNADSVCGVNSIAVGSASSSGFEFRDASFMVATTTVRARSSVGKPRVGSAVAAVASIVVGNVASTSVTVSSLSAWIDSSRIDVAAVEAADAAASVAGVGMPYGYNAGLDLRGAALSVSRSIVIANSSGSSDATCTVAGFGFGWAGSFNIDVWNTSAVIQSADVRVVFSHELGGMGGAAAAGYAVGVVSPFNIFDFAAVVSCANITAESACANAGTAIGGVSIANGAATAYLSDLVFSIQGSTLLCVTTATQAAASTIGGAAMQGNAIISNLSSVVMGSNATSQSLQQCSASSSIAGVAGSASTIDVSHISAQLVESFASSERISGASAIAGVAIYGGTPTVTSGRFVVQLSTAVCSAIVESGGPAASAVGGVSGVTKPTKIASILQGQINVSACATGPPSAVACGAAQKSAPLKPVCCNNASGTLSQPQKPSSLDCPRWAVLSDGTLHDPTRTPTRSRRTRTLTENAGQKRVTLTASTNLTTTVAHVSKTVAVAFSSEAPSTAAPPTTDAPRLNVTSPPPPVDPTTHAPNRTDGNNTTPLVLTTVPAPSRGDHLGVDTTFAQAVIITAYGSSAIAGALSPTAANKPVATGRIVDSVRCNLNGDGNEPNSWTLMPGVVGDASSPASMVASTVVLMALVLIINGVPPTYL